MNTSQFLKQQKKCQPDKNKMKKLRLNYAELVQLINDAEKKAIDDVLKDLEGFTIIEK